MRYFVDFLQGVISLHAESSEGDASVEVVVDVCLSGQFFEFTAFLTKLSEFGQKDFPNEEP